MILIKLVHPIHGLVAQQQSLRCYSRELISKWRYKYGRKYFECRIEIDGNSERRDYKKRK